MRKKLLSALLALAMVLSLLPTTAFAAAEPGTQTSDIISYVSFAYTHPPVMPDDWDGTVDEGEQAAFDALRNVFVVGFQTRVQKPAESAKKYSFAVKGSDGQFKDVVKYYYAGQSVGVAGSGAAYFEAPEGVLASTTNTYTVKVTETESGNYQEKEITLVKVSLKANNGTDLAPDNFIETEGLITEGSGYCVFAPQDKAVVYLPTLKNGTEGGGTDASQEFVGWGDISGVTSGNTYISTSKAEIADRPVYAVFGVKPVRGYVVTDTTPSEWGQAMPERKTEFKKEIAYGATPTVENAIKLRIVNTGNQPLGSSDAAADSGFYVMSNTTDHFNIAVDITEDAENANQVEGLAKYWLGAGENVNKKPAPSAGLSYLTIVCTPKDNLSAGTYTDTLTINNPLRYITQVTLTVEVKPIDVTVKMPEITKTYGQHITLDANGTWNSSNAPTVEVGDGVTAKAPKFSDLGVTITSDGFHAGAEVKEGGYGYSIEGQPSNGNYKVTLAKESGKVTVSQAKPEGDISVTASAIKKDQKLTDSVLQGAFVNPNHKDWKVEGQFEWTDATKENIIDSVPEGGYVTGHWKFTPTNNNYEAVEGTATVIVSDRTPTTIHLNTNKNRDTVTFDGAQHSLDFTLSYTNDAKEQKPLAGAITTEYKRHTGVTDTEHGDGGYSKGWPVEAGVYDVKAEYAGTEDYAPAEAIFHLTIVPRTLTMISTVKTKTYDGTTKAEINIAALIEKVPGKDDVSVSSYNAHFNDANAGDNKNVEITDIELSNPNYKLASETFHATGTIAPKSITLKVKDGTTLSKHYGETFAFDKNSFTSDEFESNDGMDNLDVTFSSAGADSDAAANTNGYPITATLNTRGNYTISNVTNVGTLKVEKAVLTENCIKQQPSANPIVEGNKKSDVVINAGSVVNPHNDDMTVEGHWELTEAGDETFSQAGFEELNWTFKPTDTTNYSGALAGTITVQVMDEQPIAITVPESILTVTYNGKEQEIDVTRITTEPAATVTVGYNGNRTDAGTCEVIITATPEAGSETDKTYGETVGRYTLTIQKADVTVTPSSGFSAKEGDTLPTVENPKQYFTGVDGDPLSGTFTWDNPTATVTQESENFKWSFVPEDTTNYNSPVTGEFTVTMAADDRTVKADVYNLPESDYAVVNTATSGLKTGEKVIFYKDADCKDPVSSETEVPAENNDKFIVNLDNDALDKETGTIYAKIVGQKTEKATISYPAELGFTLPNDMVLLHVGGANADKSETVSIVFSNDSYRSLVTADTWTVAGDGANLVTIEETTNGSATFTAKAAGTTTITVAITFNHPDTVNHQGETITVTKEFSLNITSHYVVFTDETVTGGTATANPTEADEGDAVTVTLAPASGYRANGLEAYCRSADGTPDKANKVKVSGSGSTYTFTMPASDVVLVPAFTQIPSGGGGAAGPSTTTEPDTTVITPEAAADASGEARAPVDAAEVESAVESAKQSGADEIVIEPQVTGNADKVSVELEKKSVDTMADGTDADLTVKTDAANVTLPNDSLEDLAAKTGSKVTVSVEEKTGGEVGIEVAIDGKPMDSLSGGLKVDLPKTSGGNVLVIVGEDGSEKVVKKSVVENGHAYALLDGSCSVKVVNNSKTFADVAATDWYSDAVEFAGSHELFNGVGKNNFAPNEPMTRGMFATVLWRFESGEHVDASGTFADVAEGEWYTDGIVWASRHGIITGYSSDTFAPADNVTREQLATMLYRYAKDIGLDVSETGSLNRFSDSDDVSAYAKDAVAWAVGVGLIKGNTDNTINPAGGAKRAEVATIFMRFCELITK